MKNHNYTSILIFFLVFPIFTSGCKEEKVDTITDIDGNIYHTVKIGNQVWMKENLKVTRFRNGDPLPEVKDPSDWRTLSSPAFCNYNNDTSNSSSYGSLYNWFAINDFRGLAPEGWHIPSPEEIDILLNYLGGDNIAGAKMKEKGTDYWIAPNSEATNESGFSALPGGYRFTCDSARHPIGGTFHTFGTNGFWWSTTQSYQIYSWSDFVHVRFADVVRDYTHKTYGFSVRCIKD